MGTNENLNNYTDKELLDFVKLIKEDNKNFEKLPIGLGIDDIVNWAHNKKGCPKLGRERISYNNHKFTEASKLVYDIINAKIPINALGNNGYISIEKIKESLRLKPGLSSTSVLRILSACEKELFEINKIIEESPNGIQELKQNIKDEMRNIVQQIEESETTRESLSLEIKEIKQELEHEKGIDKAKLRKKIKEALEALEAFEKNEIPETYSKKIRKLRRKSAIIDYIEEKSQEKNNDYNEQEI